MDKKDSIIDGLLAVMDKYDFLMITVTQIAQEAKVGRKTFYRHFQNKEAVLEEAIEKLFIEYSSFQENYYSSKIGVLIYNHFSFWKNHLYFLKLLYKNDLMLYLFRQYQKYISLLNQEYLRRIKSDNNTSIYANAFTAGIFWSMLYTWLENGAKESPKELSNICINLLQNQVSSK